MKDKILYIVMAVYIACVWLISWASGALELFSLMTYSRPVLTTTGLILSLFMGWLCFYTMIKIRPPRLTAYLFNDLKTRWLTKERLVQALPFLLGFMLFISAFSSMKSIIPVLQPYSWDPFFQGLDKALHLGVDPWRLLQPVFGDPVITFIINFVYNMWFPVMFAVVYWQAFTLKRPELRFRFLLSFFLCWIICGTILAVIFSSVGPCFYDRLLPDLADPYAGLMEYLRAVDGTFPVWALTAQDMLWDAYERSALEFGSGISAMPSVHVSVAWLLVLFGFQIGRKCGYAFSVFFAFIMIGSVHLGWHYAADGYLGIIVTSLIWWAVGRLQPKISFN